MQILETVMIALSLVLSSLQTRSSERGRRRQYRVNFVSSNCADLARSVTTCSRVMTVHEGRASVPQKRMEGSNALADPHDVPFCTNTYLVLTLPQPFGACAGIFFPIFLYTNNLPLPTDALLFSGLNTGWKFPFYL